MALTTTLDVQQAHALGRQHKQGQAEPMRETAASTSGYRCPSRCPTADCAKLGGSGEHPTWSAEGMSQTQTTAHPFLLQKAAAAGLQTCCHQGGLLNPSILGKKTKGRTDIASLIHHQGSDKQ